MHYASSVALRLFAAALAFAALLEAQANVQSLKEATAAVPQLVSIQWQPTGGDAAAIFRVTYSDDAGTGDLIGVRLLINRTLSVANACYVQYNFVQNAMYLADDLGTILAGPLAPGSSSSLSNSQCTLSGIGSSVKVASSSTKTVVVSFALTFNEYFFYGYHSANTYALGVGEGGTQGWVQSGGEFLGFPGTLIPLAVSPSLGGGTTQTFSVVYSAVSNPSEVILSAYILFNNSVTFSNGCYVRYIQPYNELYLYDDSGTIITQPVTPGSSVSVSNSQCTLSGAGSSVTFTPLTMTVNYALSFSDIDANGPNGTYSVFALASEDTPGEVDAWYQLGTWAPIPTNPLPLSLTPNSGIGPTQSFTAVYSYDKGASTLGTARLLINTGIGEGGCYINYNPATNAMILNGATETLTPGSSESISNGLCTLSGQGTTVTTSGNNMTVVYALSFSSSFKGLQNIYLLSGSYKGDSAGWVQMGTWTP